MATFTIPIEDSASVAKPDLGTKRLCAHCGARFYDLNHAPATCPKCGSVFEAAAVTARGRPETARAAAREVEAVPERQDAEFVSLEEADAEVHGGGAKKKQPAATEGEDDVEIDDEGMDDDAFIEEPEEEDTDVTEIIGNDIENEEET
jgi:uncharacterized protein (TIGR02300 family)